MISIIYYIGTPIGFIIGCRTIYTAMISDIHGKVEPIDRGLCMILGTCGGILTGLLWPLVLGIFLLRNFLFESKRTKRVRELDEREERIRKMERELGIR